MTTVRDVSDPRVYFAIRTAGYAIFVCAGVFIAAAFHCAISGLLALKPAATPRRPRPASVLAFAPRRTRTRIVVR